jgi:hypothetical protein
VLTAARLRRALATAILLPALALGAPAARAQVAVSGVIYAQWSAQLDSLSPANNFDVTRAYVNVIAKFTGGFSTRITTDVYRDTDSTAGGRLVGRLRFAYGTWNPSGSPLTIRFGLTQTLWEDFEDQLWDYRMQGVDVMDRSGYTSPADFGLAADGNFGGELLDVSAMAFDGEGYGKSPGDQHKDFAARASLRLLGTDDATRVGGLRVTGYAQLGTPSGGGTRNRFIALASYRSKHLTLAGEYVATRDSLAGTANSLKNGRILEGFGVLHVGASPLALMGLVAVIDPTTCTSYLAGTNCPPAAQHDARTVVIAGVSYQLTPSFRLLLDVDRTTYQTPASGSAPRSTTLALFQTQFVY